jgi:osmotically inducible protein OsmC
MKRNASAVWHGNLKNGKGTLSTDSAVLNQTPYSFSSRFAAGSGTNPEELIAAAHAGCFTMALSAALDAAGFVADSLTTTAALTLENHPQTSWTITEIRLSTTGSVPGISPEKFAEVAAGAKANCPVSRVLKAAISLDARLGLTRRASEPPHTPTIPLRAAACTRRHLSGGLP